MEDNLNGILHQLKATSMEDDLNGRRFNGFQPSSHTKKTLREYDIEQDWLTQPQLVLTFSQQLLRIGLEIKTFSNLHFQES